MSIRHVFNSTSRVLLVAFGLSAASTVEAFARNCSERPYQSGEASWYGPGLQGNLTANGEVFNQYRISAAHRSLPLGSFVRVVNQNNGRELIVRINDRGPYAEDSNGRDRVIDLSRGAAQNLGYIDDGVTPVSIYRCEANI